MSSLNIKNTKIIKSINDFSVEIEFNSDTALLLEKLIYLKKENVFNNFIDKLNFTWYCKEKKK